VTGLCSLVKMNTLFLPVQHLHQINFWCDS